MERLREILKQKYRIILLHPVEKGLYKKVNKCPKQRKNPY
jgi:predicted acetyltransferase